MLKREQVAQVQAMIDLSVDKAIKGLNKKKAASSFKTVEIKPEQKKEKEVKKNV